MDKVVTEIKFSTQQKQNDIADNAIKKVAAENQRDRQLDIFRIKDDAEFSVGIADIHIYQRIKADNGTKKDIHEQTAEKADEQTIFLAPHKTERGGQYDQEIRNNAAKSECAENGALHQETYKNKKSGHNNAFHESLYPCLSSSCDV